MSIFSIFNSSKTATDVKGMHQSGAVILDVRTRDEFSYGHVKGSKNIPLNEIQNKINEIKKWNKPVITCCRSGNRSGMAQGVLSQNGIECVNGGSWQQVDSAIA
ncbi:MAG: rhodanese-like domain-containing protein [Bacteroidia bacterium]